MLLRNCAPAAPTIVTSFRKVGKANQSSPQHRGIPRHWFLTIATFELIALTGCATKLIAQADSFVGTRTEELRDWVREDIYRDKLVVFVHGFNSSKDEAWGKFPALVKEDDDFRDFNIHQFGYPTKLCRQVDDIRNQGDFLASFLTSIFKSTQPNYRQVILVGHSMGGLVILHALLKLERDNFPLLIDQNIKVLSFGTPYFGVENTNVLELFCDNRQANDMGVLNDRLNDLGREWSQRFNQQQGSAVRHTPQISLYAFRGIADRFVTKTSACGYPQTPCEDVDGDHNSIVKPQTREHLAYRKLKELAEQPKVPPTTAGKIGIWVARLTGDDTSYAEQRGMISRLEHFFSQAEPQLQEIVEIRQLPADIPGNTLREKEAAVKRLGKEYQASIVVWGQVTKHAGGGELHPRVTLTKSVELPTKTAILAPMSQYAPQLLQLNMPPETIRLPPHPIHEEPIQLARFILAVTFMEKKAWTSAAKQLDHYLGAKPSMAVRSADIYSYAGLAHANGFGYSEMPDSLTKALDMYEMARTSYQKEQDWENYADVLNNLGLTYGMLAHRGIAPGANLQKSVTALTEAAHLREKQHNWPKYANIQNNLGLSYRMLAEVGVAPEENLQHSVEALIEAARRYQAQQDMQHSAGTYDNLGVTYQVLARRGVAPHANLQRAVQAVTEAVRLYEELQDWIGYAAAQNNMGLGYLVLGEHGDAPEENLPRAVAALTQAARLRMGQENWAEYAKTQSNLGMTYQVLARRGIAPEENLQLSLTALTEAARLLKGQQNWGEYAHVQNNLGLTYQVLAQHGVTPEKNLQLSLTGLTEAARLRKEQQNWAEYAHVQNNLGLTYQLLAQRGIVPDENLQHSLAALKEAARLNEEQQNRGDYAGVQTNLAAVYWMLAQRGVAPEANLHQSVTALTEAALLYKDQQKWMEYAMVQRQLGRGHQLLALFRVPPEVNLLHALAALTEAARLYGEHQKWTEYKEVQKNLGDAYWMLAQRGIAPEENLRLADQAFKKAGARSQ